MNLFASSFPKLLIAELAVLPLHHETDDYRAERASVEASRAIYSSGTDLSTRLDELALRGLEPGIDPSRRARNLADARAKVADARKKLEETGSAGAVSARAPDDGSENSVLSSLNDKGELIMLASGGARATVAGKDIDLLIYGTLEAIGSYVAVDIYAFDAILGRQVFSARSYADPSDPAPLARDLGERICSLVAGRPYARLDFETKPESAVLDVNGKVIGSTTRRFYLFERSSLSVSASAPGYVEMRQTFDVDLGQRKKISIELRPAATGIAKVDTVPSGLPVFVDGLFAGASPLEVPLTGERSVVAAQSADGGSARSVLPATGSPSVVLAPDSSEKNRVALVDKRRDAFYDALGLFMLSLPATSLSYGLQSTFADAYGRDSANEALSDRYTASTISLGVFGAASAGLLVNVVIRLIGYIEAAK